MQKFISILKTAPLFVVFSALYPVFFLYSENYYQVGSYVLARSLLISLAAALVVFLVCITIFRSIKKGALIAFVILVLFYSYGHTFSQVDNHSILGFMIGRHRFLIPIYSAIGVALCFLLIKQQKHYADIYLWSNTISSVLLGFVILLIGFKMLSSSLNQTNLDTPLTNTVTLTNDKTKHDVYYIVLDAYSRADLLQKDGFDNQAFLASLKEMGFLIPECGQSNYNATALSLSSTLNMNYLDALGLQQKSLSLSNMQSILAPYIKNSLVRSKFSSYGYKFITNISVFPFLDIPDADIYFGNDLQTKYVSNEFLETMKFQELFMDTTLARPISEFLTLHPEYSKKIPTQIMLLISPMSVNIDSDVFGGDNYLYYQISQFTLKKLIETPRITEPKFVYSHLLVTHPPYTFTSTGEFQSQDQYSSDSYHNQITYLNSRLIPILKQIIEQSSNPPIIILQADHSEMKSKNTLTTRNFQAYFLPGMKQADLDSHFTNLNTFRLIFSKYFDESLPMLPNNSFLINHAEPLDFKPVESSCPPN